MSLSEDSISGVSFINAYAAKQAKKQVSRALDVARDLAREEERDRLAGLLDKLAEARDERTAKLLRSIASAFRRLK